MRIISASKKKTHTEERETQNLDFLAALLASDPDAVTETSPLVVREIDWA